MATRRVTDLEKWVGDELQRLGFSKYHAARHRKLIVGDPKWQEIGARHSKKIYEAVRAFNDRYNYGIQSMRMTADEYREHLLKWNSKEVRRFDRLRAAFHKARERMQRDRERYLERYAARNLPA